MNGKIHATLLCLAIALLLAGCSVLSTRPAEDATPSLPEGGGQPPSPMEALASAEAVSGWTPSGEAQAFDAENLYDLVNGQADAYFAYAFEQVAVQTYENAEGAALRIEIWQLATPADAYGLFTTYRSGNPVAIGNEGDADPGRRLDFWLDRYFVRLFAPQVLPDAELEAFAQATAGALPSPGEQPALVSHLPREGLLERETIFFHEEISIQSTLWLGGENLLGLGPETDGLLARYHAGNETVTLLLVQYPDAGAASAGLRALQTGQLDNLVVAETREGLLGAVFGTASEAEAHTLLLGAFDND